MTKCDYCPNEISVDDISENPINIDFVNQSTFFYCSIQCAFKMLAQELGAHEVSIGEMTDMAIQALKDLDEEES